LSRVAQLTLDHSAVRLTADNYSCSRSLTPDASLAFGAQEQGRGRLAR